ncbi:MAG: chloride channel protein [Clostridium sp.]|uniref:chloride channel protein n=1 Tax=Clostridium sp. TaxID=1506 RepID=UPI003F2B63D3
MKKFLSLCVAGIYSIIIGAGVGATTWLFLTLIFSGIDLIWYDFIFKMNNSYLILLVCIFGGIIVGLCQKYFGKYPKTMPTVLKEFKETKRVEYKSLPKSIISALVVLWFGASLGPEAALSGIIGGLVTLVGDLLKYGLKRKDISEDFNETVIESSIEATVGIIFAAPLYGFYNIISDKDRIKKVKTVIYVLTVSSGFCIFELLSQLDNRASFITRFSKSVIGRREVIFFIPLLIIGLCLTVYYNKIGSILKSILKPLENYKVIKAVLGGFMLGILGITVPYIFFSGEHALKDLMLNWKSIGVIWLLIICLLKLLATELCISTGWIGGHIFPVMFSGVAMGFAFSIIFGIDPVFSACIVSTIFISAVLKNYIVAIFLLILFFPVNLAIYIIIAAILGVELIKKIELRKCN